MVQALVSVPLNRVERDKVQRRRRLDQLSRAESLNRVSKYSSAFHASARTVVFRAWH